MELNRLLRLSESRRRRKDNSAHANCVSCTLLQSFILARTCSCCKVLSLQCLAQRSHHSSNMFVKSAYKQSVALYTRTLVFLIRKRRHLTRLLNSLLDFSTCSSLQQHFLIGIVAQEQIANQTCKQTNMLKVFTLLRQMFFYTKGTYYY